MVTESEIRVDRVSIPFTVPSSASSGDHFYQRMFTEDVANVLFPHSGEVDKTPVFQLSTNDKRISQQIIVAFAHHTYHRSYAYPRHPLSSRLSAFGNQTVYRLLLSGAETFEVAPMVIMRDEIVGFSVVPVDGIWRFGRRIWQIVPKNALTGSHKKNPNPVNLLEIPRDQVVFIRLPREYRSIPKGLKSLRLFKSSIPNLQLQNLNPDGTLQTSYDIREYSKIEKRAVASITQSTGWDGRNTFNKEVTSYYMMRRFLRFEEFKVKLREAVVDGINQILKIAGDIADFSAELSLHHLPTLEEISASRETLVAGRIGFSQLLDQYSLYRRGRSISQEQKKA